MSSEALFSGFFVYPDCGWGNVPSLLVPKMQKEVVGNFPVSFVSKTAVIIGIFILNLFLVKANGTLLTCYFGDYGH